MFNKLENNNSDKIYNCNDNNREIKHSNFINLKENEKFQINNIKNSLENSNNSNNIIQNSSKNNEIDNTNLKKSSIKENNSKNKNDNKMKEINQIKANDFSKSEIIINNESKISVSKESQYDYAIVNKNEDNSDIHNKYNDWNIINIKKRKFNFKDNIANFHNNVFNIKNENENKINYQLTNENLINKLFDLELKILYNGTLNEFPKLKFPITIDFSSLILNSDSLLSDIRKNIKPNDLSIIVDLGMILKEIRNYIISIEEIENSIVLPKDEDIILEINGAKYINSLFANIEIDEINRQINKNNDSFFNIYYSFEIKQYPLLINDGINGIIYSIKPTLKELLLNKSKYDNLRNVRNFEVTNKYGKIIFIDPIDLSGKVAINEIIQILEGTIILEDPRVDKLKAKISLNFDLGPNLEGKDLEIIKNYLKNRNSTFIKYENKILSFNCNF